LQPLGRLREDRGGVGTLIAAVFIILIIMTGYSLSLLTTNKNQEYYNIMNTMTSLDYYRNREAISIKNVQITTNLKLNVTAENDGPKQSSIVLIGLFDRTQYPEKDMYTSVSYSLTPGGQVSNIGSSISVSWGHNYVVQLVTAMGNAIDTTFYPANSVKCMLTFLTLPSSVSVGNNVTVLLIVTHNQTQPDSIQNITAKLTVNPSSSVKLMQGPQQLSVLGLKSGSSAFFKWVYNITQTGTIYFNASYIQAPQGIYTISQVTASQSGLHPRITISGFPTIPRATWTSYTITAYGEDGNVLPFAWITVGASSLNVMIRLSGTSGSGTDPYTGSANVNGQLIVQIRSSVAGGTTFTLYVVYGHVYTSMTIIQSP
jgi:hypothetical protein